MIGGVGNCVVLTTGTGVRVCVGCAVALERHKDPTIAAINAAVFFIFRLSPPFSLCPIGHWPYHALIGLVGT